MKLTQKFTRKFTLSLTRNMAPKLAASLALLAVSVPVYAHSGHGAGSAHGLLHIEHIVSLLAIGALVVVAFASNRR